VPITSDIKGPDPLIGAIPSKPPRKKRKPYGYKNVQLGRRPTPLEERLLSLTTIPPTLDRLTADLVAALGFAYFDDARDRRLGSVRATTIDLLWNTARLAAAYGAHEHRQEWQRQGLAHHLSSDAVLARLDHDLPVHRHILTQADTVLGGDYATVKRLARALVNRSFALGRRYERQRLIALKAVDAELLVLSAVLDHNTCDTCYELDGTEFEEGSPEEEEYQVPLDQCESAASGTSLCRCQVIAVGSEPDWVNAAIEHLEILHLRGDYDLDTRTPEERSGAAKKAWDTRGRRAQIRARLEKTIEKPAADIPPNLTFYHGTSGVKLDSILRQGLKTDYVGDVFPGLSEKGHVYFASTQKDAAVWAEEALKQAREGKAGQIVTDAAILEIHIPPDVRDKIEHDKNFEDKAGPQEPNLFQFHGDIPPAWITGVCHATINDPYARMIQAQGGRLPFVEPKWTCEKVSLAALFPDVVYAAVILAAGPERTALAADAHPLTPQDRHDIAIKAWDTRGRTGADDVTNTYAKAVGKPDLVGRRANWSPRAGGLLFVGTTVQFYPHLRSQPVAYLTDDFDEATGYAEGRHDIGGGHAGTPVVRTIQAKPGRTVAIDREIAAAMADDAFDESFLQQTFAAARQRGARYVVYDHPAFSRDAEQHVIVSLYPKEDLKLSVAGRARVDLAALTPEERSQAAVKAWDTRGRLAATAWTEQATADPAEQSLLQTWIDQGHVTGTWRPSRETDPSAPADAIAIRYPIVTHYSDDPHRQFTDNRSAYFHPVEVYGENLDVLQGASGVTIAGALTLRRMKILDAEQSNALGYHPDRVAALIAQGYDGVSDEQAQEFIAFHPKSQFAETSRGDPFRKIGFSADISDHVDLAPLTPDERTAAALKAWDVRGRKAKVAWNDALGFHAVPLRKLFKMSREDLADHLLAGVSADQVRATASLGENQAGDPVERIDLSSRHADPGSPNALVDDWFFNMEYDFDNNAIHVNGLRVEAHARHENILVPLLRNIAALSDQLQVDRVEFDADLDLGGYAWARIGGTAQRPEQLAADVLRLIQTAEEKGTPYDVGELSYVNKGQLSALRQLGSTGLQQVKDFIGQHRKDPTLPRQLAALRVNGERIGRYLLRGLAWEGQIDRTDPEAMKLFHHFVGAPAHG
jgi:hypothetical protein